MGNVNQRPQQDSTIPQLLEDHQDSSSTFTCEICIEPVTLPNTKFNNSNRCIHPFCTDCIIKYIQVKLQDNVSDIKCPALNCRHSLDPLSCRPQITHQLFDKWCDVLCDSTVLGLDWVYCPNTDCSALIINECGGGGNLKRCECPNCKKPFCFRCRIPWHDGYTCKESGVEIRDQNDVAFGSLCERNKWMRCPGCRHCVEHVEGCPIIRCRCGVNFCYNCGKRVYHHWCNCLRSASFYILTVCLCLAFVAGFLLVLAALLAIFYVVVFRLIK